MVSPCAYVVGLLDDLVIRELELERRGLRYWMADPNLWVPFDDGTAFGQWLDHSRTQANLEELGVSAADIEGYWAYEELFDEVRRKLRQGERDTWVGEAPTRAEIEELLGADRTMIDLVFEASIADVLDDHLSDERLKTALFGQGIIGTWGGPEGPGHGLDQADALPGRHGRPGAAVGIRRGRHGDGQLRDRRRGARGGRGARLRGPGGRDRSRRGRHPRGRHLAAGGHRDLERRPEADPRHARRPRGRRPPSASGSSAGRSAARWSSSTRRSSGCRTGAPRRARPGRRGRRSTSPARSTRRSAPSRPRSAASRPSRFGEIYFQTGYDPSPAPEGKHLMSVFGQYAPYELSDGQLGLAPRRGRAPVHRADRPLRARASRIAWSSTRSSAPRTSSRGSG